MSAFEYLLLFAAVLLGLAVTDIAISLHRLLAAGAKVKWDALAPMAAVVALLKIVTQWWAWFGAARIARGLTFEMFLGVLAGAILLFLLAAEALPDEVPADGLELADHFAAARRRFWLIFAIHLALVTAVDIWAQMRISGARMDWRQPGFILIALAIGLSFMRSRAIQAAALAGCIVFYLAQNLGRPLSM